MFKNKRFLIGLGSGLIAGAILLQLMNVAASGTGTITLPEDKGSGNEVMTVDELTTMAEHLGYKVYKSDEKLYTQMEVDELIRSATSPQESSEESQEGTDNQSEDQPADAKAYSITILSGMNSDEVAAALLDARLIDDAQTFKDELIRLNRESRIQVGTFTFDEKPTIEEIIAKITKA